MGRFIHFCLRGRSGSDGPAGLQITDENSDRWRIHRSGIADLRLSNASTPTCSQAARAQISPFFIPAVIVNMAAGQISHPLWRQGPISATATACATSANSIGDSARMIMYGDADVMIAGGAEASVTPLSVAGFAALRALSTRNDEPTRASRPFDRDRDGFVIGEGAGILILEELEFAKARGAKILAKYWLRHERRRLSHDSIAPEGAGAQRSMGRLERRKNCAGRSGLCQRPRHFNACRRRQRIAPH